MINKIINLSCVKQVWELRWLQHNHGEGIGRQTGWGMVFLLTYFFLLVSILFKALLLLIRPMGSARRCQIWDLASCQCIKVYVDCAYECLGISLPLHHPRTSIFRYNLPLCICLICRERERQTARDRAETCDIDTSIWNWHNNFNELN